MVLAMREINATEGKKVEMSVRNSFRRQFSKPIKITKDPYVIYADFNTARWIDKSNDGASRIMYRDALKGGY